MVQAACESSVCVNALASFRWDNGSQMWNIPSSVVHLLKPFRLSSKKDYFEMQNTPRAWMQNILYSHSKSLENNTEFQMIFVSAKMGIICVLINIIASLLFYPIFGFDESGEDKKFSADFLFLAIFLAPIIETLVLYIFFNTLRKFPIVITYATFMVLVAYEHRPLDALEAGKIFSFSYMVYQYFLFSRFLRPMKTIKYISITHSVQNACVLLIFGGASLLVKFGLIADS